MAAESSARHFAAETRAEAPPVIRAYAARVAALADQGAEIVVLPEKFVGITPAYAADARAILEAVTREHRVTFVAGFNTVEASERRNLTVVFRSDGGVVLNYDVRATTPLTALRTTRRTSR